MPARSQLGEDVGAAALVRDEELARVADRLRLDMLVGARVLQHRRGVDAGLGGEGAGPDEGRVAVRRAVEDLVEGARGLRQRAEGLVGDAGLEAVAVAVLQLERADEGDEVGIAAALAEAVERALDLARAGLDGGEGIGDGAAAIVMGVDAETVARHVPRDLGDDALDLVRQRAAVGVAQHDPARAGLVGGRGAGERVSRRFAL